MNMTSYLWMMGISSGVCVCMTFFLLRADGVNVQKAGVSSAALLPLGWALGFAGAKLLYLLLMLPFVLMRGLGAFLMETKIDELAFYGGVAGVVLAAFLASKIAGIPAKRFLNAFAPAGAFMTAMARFAEYYLGMLGAGDYMEEGFFPLAITNSWGEYYLAVFMLEGLLGILAMVFSFVHRKEDVCFVRTLFYLCLPQIFCESLRIMSIAWLFVRAEQLLCYLYVEAVLIAWSVRIRKTNVRWYLPWLVGLIVCALTVAEEFALDKTDIPQTITYACMIAGLAVLAVMEHLACSRFRKVRDA